MSLIMSQCTQCKFNIPNGARVCGYCGSRQPREGLSEIIGGLLFWIVAIMLLTWWWSDMGWWESVFAVFTLG